MQLAEKLVPDFAVSLSDGAERFLDYYVEDHRAVQPGERALRARAEVRKQLCHLTTRQAIALRYRFAIEVDKDREIGDMFVITRERCGRLRRSRRRLWRLKRGTNGKAVEQSQAEF